MTMKRLLTLSLLLLSPLQQMHALVLESNDIESLREHTDPTGWVVLDIDNTVAKTVQQLGSDQWFRQRIAHAMQNGFPFEKALNEWTAMQYLSDLEPVQPETIGLVRELQDAGYTVLAITARGMRLGTRTVSQLAAIGVDFTRTAPIEGEIFWPRGVSGQDAEHVLWEGGVLYTAGQNKGVCLTKLLEHAEEKPSSILFMDDSRKHVLHMEAACEQLGMSFVGIRYGACDGWVQELTAECAQQLFAPFEKLPCECAH